MGLKDEKEEKNLYYRTRETSSGLSREDAAELLGISVSTLGRIERGVSCPHPDHIAAMVDVYGEPKLYSYYCSNDCAVGMRCSVDEVKPVTLAEATLGILSSVNSFNKWKDTFVDIAMDGSIDSEEVSDFKSICKTLDEISSMVERLKLCVETLKHSKNKKQ